MIPQRLKSAASQCVLNTLCKKANSRKQMRAFLVKLAADRLQEAYKVSPSQSLLKKVNSVPGAKDRLGLVRSSLAKKAVAPIPSPTAGPNLNAAPPAIKPPGPLGQAATPNVPNLAKPAPGMGSKANPYASSAAMPKAPNPVTPAPSAGLSPDTQYHLQNPRQSAGTSFYDLENPVRQEMSAPDPNRLMPKPKMAPGMSNEINYGTGPSGNPVVADIVPGGTMPVARERVPTAAEQASDAAYKEKFRAFRARGNPTVNLGPRTLKQRQAAYAAAQNAPQATPAPELAPVPIHEPLPEPPVATPVQEDIAPRSVEVPPLSSVIPEIKPSPASAAPATDTARPQAKIPSPYSTNPLGLNRADVPTANFSQLNPQVLANSAGRQLGQAVNPNFLFNLFSNMGLAIPQGISNLFTNSGTPLGSRAASPSSYMQMVNDAVNDNSWQD